MADTRPSAARSEAIESVEAERLLQGELKEARLERLIADCHRSSEFHATQMTERSRRRSGRRQRRRTRMSADQRRKWRRLMRHTRSSSTQVRYLPYTIATGVLIMARTASKIRQWRRSKQPRARRSESLCASWRGRYAVPVLPAAGVPRRRTDLLPVRRRWRRGQEDALPIRRVMRYLQLSIGK